MSFASRFRDNLALYSRLYSALHALQFVAKPLGVVLFKLHSGRGFVRPQPEQNFCAGRYLALIIASFFAAP